MKVEMMKTSKFCKIISLNVLILSSLYSNAFASYGFYVGKNLTEDGSVLIGGTGEEVSGHWLTVVPAKKHPKGSTMSVGATDKAYMPGKLIEIPQVPETFKYINMNYSDFEGFPAPLTNGGLNEHGVAVRDIWSNSRDELVEMTPNPQTGPQYSDLARIALERAKTAREAVEIIGDLINEHGYTTYGGNSHLIADKNEGWVVLQFAGGKGLWVAERLGPDDVRVSYPGYIGDIPADITDNEDYMASPNFYDFAVEQGWWKRDGDKPFNVHAVYSEQDRPMRTGQKHWTIETVEKELHDMAPVTLKKMMKLVRDPRVSTERSGYGEVAQLRDTAHSGLNLLWVAPTGSVTAPFVPYHIGIDKVIPEYGIHRYLFRDAGSTFLNADYQSQEATQFAGRLFKRIMYHACANPETIMPEITQALEAFEAKQIDDIPEVQATADILYKAEKPELASKYLTDYSVRQSERALDLGEALLASIEARSKLLYGIETAEGTAINAEGTDMPCRKK
ncbi:C69 family dipeptidase [Brucella pituitosa]|uniref:C69 family dipeptidase n=1 Tax=Brucella pituitosa TaxID=571256 RepID=UPI003F4AC66A